MADGNIDLLDANMTFYNVNGNTSHSHEVTNFKWNRLGGVAGASAGNAPGANNASAMFVATGTADVGTNGVISWFGVPITLSLGGEKVISILLGDEETDNHFARQNMYGIVSSITPCGDTPGPNMQVPVPCE
jgi:hypothetical protein